LATAWASMESKSNNITILPNDDNNNNNNNSTLPNNSDLQSSLGAELNERFLGDFIGIMGSLLFGLYDVIYTKETSKIRDIKQNNALFSKSTDILEMENNSTSTELTNAISAAVSGLIGLFTFAFLWIPLPILHFFDIETFQWPDSTVWYYLLVIGILGTVYNG